jgi:perosamine synthetase
LLELGIPVIEDCAQSLGAEYRGCRVGSFGQLSTCSFYATKMITTGEGGMVLTNNKEHYRRIIETRDYDKKPLTPTKYNYKMTDFQAALGLSQLGKLQHFIERRKQIASLYTQELSKHGLDLPKISSHVKSVFYRYVIMVDSINKVQKRLKEKGVTCERPIFKPLNKNFSLMKCPNSDIAYNRALSIPIYPGLSDEDIQHITQAFNEAFR